MPNKKQISSTMLFLFIFSCAFIIRLSDCFIRNPTFESDFFLLAQNILHHGIYSLDGIHPTMYRTPLYPLMLSFISFLFGTKTIVFIIFTACIGACNALLCAQLSYKIFGRKTALISGIVYAAIPYLAWQEITSESGFLSIWILAGLNVLWIVWEKPEKIPLAAGAGILFAFAYLTRPTIAFVPIFMGIFIISAAIAMKKSIQKYLIALAIFFIFFTSCIIPWAVYNKKSFGHYYAGQIAFWETVYAGNHPKAFDVYPNYSFDNLFPLKAPAMWPHETDEYKQTQSFKKISLEQFKEIGALRITVNSLKKFAYLWSPRLTPYHSRVGNSPDTRKTLDTNRTLAENLIFSIPYILLIVFGGIGLWGEGKQRWLIFLTCGLILSFSLPYMITTVCSRYAVPAYFILIIWAGRGIQTVLPK
ncbi:MAG TPA: glycosyltransferase family 39 protein [Candidatus Omnitrophota bacterium]|nr:glycosyltransferase family 39 protein [Candidatus Omnitrophota bacterium]HPT07330.1 glycosyltransferase family 39 protein [Candidatus Omnitrophota bacterium]